jgi:hypothetical protein
MYVSIKFIIIISHFLVLLTVTMAIRPGFSLTPWAHPTAMRALDPSGMKSR